MKKINKAPMIQKAEPAPSKANPNHIEITVPRDPKPPKPKQEVMTREEIANTIMWARKDEIDQARVGPAKEYKLQTSTMSKSEKSDLLH